MVGRSSAGRLVLAALAVVLADGGIIQGTVAPPAALAGTAAPVDCTDGQSAPLPAREPLSRLSKLEYARTVRDLIGADVAIGLPALAGLIAGIPDDDRQGGFDNINWSLSADHVSGYLGVANELGVQISVMPWIRRKILPCATDRANVDAACLEAFLDGFATRAYRRPLEGRERDELLRFYADQHAKAPARALSALITRVLVSPAFLFKHGAGPARSGADCAQARIDESYARASRLSYALWGSMPDAGLFAAASAQDLLDDAKLDAELGRMLGNTRSRQWLRTFFRQWLHYEELPVEGYSIPFLDGLDRAHLHDHAVEELDSFIDAIVWTDRGNYRDLMTSRKVITKAPAIRKIYGLPAVPAGGAERAAANRAGILTRVAILAHGTDEASLVKRGAMVRRQLLCDPLSPPDPAALPSGSLVPPAKDYRLTTRQRWEARTAPTICQGCHRMINPLGFLLEAYDGIGRFRTVERQLIPNSSPEAYNELPIDTAVVAIAESRTEPKIDGPVALSALLGASRKANTCFVRQLTKFVAGRPVDASELPELQALADEMMQPGGSIRRALSGIVKRHTTQASTSHVTNRP